MFIALQLTTPLSTPGCWLSSVAGDALTRHLGVILPAVMLALKEKLGTPDEQLVRGTVTPADSVCVLSHPGRHVPPRCRLCLGDGQLSGRDPVRGGRHRTGSSLRTCWKPPAALEVGMRQAAAIVLNIYCSPKADYTPATCGAWSQAWIRLQRLQPRGSGGELGRLNAITKVRGCQLATSGGRQFGVFPRLDAVGQLQHLSLRGWSRHAFPPTPFLPCCIIWKLS